MSAKVSEGQFLAFGKTRFKSSATGAARCRWKMLVQCQRHVCRVAYRIIAFGATCPHTYKELGDRDPSVGGESHYCMPCTAFLGSWTYRTTLL